MSNRFKAILMVVVVCAVLISVGSATGASPASDNTWTRYYGGDQSTIASDALPAADGGYFIVGVTGLDFNSELPGGDVYLLRIDADGNILWERTYGGDGQDVGGSVIPTGDGNLLIVGYTTSFGAGDIDAYLIKVDQDGNELWSRTYGGPLDEMVGGAAATADGGYILGGNIVDPNDVIADPGAAGYAGLAGRSNLLLIRVDAEGNERWIKTIDSDDNVVASGGAQTSDGSLLALTTILYYPDHDDDIELLRFDSDGTVLWTRAWRDDIVSGQDLISTSDGNYLISAAYSNADNEKEDFLLIKVDPDGNELWRSTFGEPDLIDYGAEVAETSDHGFIVVGERVPNLITWDIEIVLAKVDEEGHFLWQQTTPASHTMFATIFEHPEGGYVIVGSTFRGSVFNILLIRTDAAGHLE